MATNFIEAIKNTMSFIQTPIGIFILILLTIIIIESFVIWLLIWVLKNQFNKNSKENDQQVKGGVQ